MAEPVQALLALAKATPDPKVVSNWLTAYLGKRPLDARKSALRALVQSFEGPQGAVDPRATALILRVIKRMQETLS